MFLIFFVEVPPGHGFLSFLFSIFYSVGASLGLFLILISLSFLFSFLFSNFFRGGAFWGWIFEFSIFYFLFGWGLPRADSYAYFCVFCV